MSNISQPEDSPRQDAFTKVDVDDEEDRIDEIEQLESPTIYSPIKTISRNEEEQITQPNDDAINLEDRQEDSRTIIVSPSKSLAIKVDETNETSSNSDEDEDMQMFKDTLTTLALTKMCPEHKQCLLNICENAECKRRFWCGICCVKHKEEFAKNIAHIKTIDDYVEEKIQHLKSTKSFSSEEKDKLASEIDHELTNAELIYNGLSKAVDTTIEKYKTEVFVRLEKVKEEIHLRVQEHREKTCTFIKSMSSKVDNNKVINLSNELSEIEKKVEAGDIDVFEVINILGKKVNNDIPEVERCNKEFIRTKTFLEFIQAERELVRESSLPKYQPIEEHLENFLEEVEVLLTPALKSSIIFPSQDLEKLYKFYDRISASDEGTNNFDKLRSYIGLGSQSSGRVSIESIQKNKKRMKPLVNLEERPPFELDNELNSPIQTKTGLSRSSLSSLHPQAMSELFASQIDSPGNNIIRMRTESKNDRQDNAGAILDDFSMLSSFSPIIELGGNNYLFVTFAKNCPDNGEIFGVKIYGVGGEKGTAGNRFLYSSDEEFMVNKRITNLCYIYREVDDKEILAMNSKEGTIFLMEINAVLVKGKKKKKLSLSLLKKIWPYSSDTNITSMRNLQNSEFLFCTTIEGEVIVYNTLNENSTHCETYIDGAISSACFIGNYSFLALGSGAQSMIHDNSISFISIDLKSTRMKGDLGPILNTRFKIKNAHEAEHGVLCLGGDNEGELPLIFSGGAGPKSTVKIWNYETRVLILEVSQPLSLTQYFMNVVPMPSESSNAERFRADLSEPKGAWKKRKDEISSYKRLRDEKKRKKTSDPADQIEKQEYIVIVATDKQLRTIRVNVNEKLKVECKEITLDFATQGSVGSCILQSVREGSDLMIFASKSLGYVEMFDIKLS